MLFHWCDISFDRHNRRITSIPSRVMFEIALFPHNLPLPRPKTLGRALGVALHVVHLLVKWSRRNLVVAKEDPDDLWKSEVDWSTSFDDLDGRKGWNWVNNYFFHNNVEG